MWRMVLTPRLAGVGPKTAQRLLRQFGSVANIRRAGIKRLSEIVTQQNAERVLEYLEKRDGPR
jgi:excinuclease UvrABC nuclease subunit